MMKLFKFEQGFSKSYRVKETNMSFELRQTDVFFLKKKSLTL